MQKPDFAFCVAYVNEELWEESSPGLAKEHGYVPMHKDTIKFARNKVYRVGVQIKVFNPEERDANLPDDYILHGNLIRVIPSLTLKPVPRRGPDIELHSRTEEGLAKLIKTLKLSK